MKEQPLRAVLTPILIGFGLELEELEIIPAGRRKLLRIVVDGDGETGRGPTLDEIADVTRAISVALDDSSATGAQPYTLEVSTRGVGRPLTKPAHWRRNTGRLVRVDVTSSPNPVEGRITAADAEGVEIAVGDGAAPLRLQWADVKKASVQVELNRPGTDPDEEKEE